MNRCLRTLGSHLNTLILAMTLGLAACSGLPDKADETSGWSASKLYTEAREEQKSGNFEKAIRLFERLESRYPFGRYAQQAQMEIAYLHYKNGDQAQALAAADRFIKLHPNHANVDYLYYLKGLINFNDDLGLVAGFAGQDLSERDPKAAREAFESFRELTTRFPDSKYAADGAARMKYLVNAVASNEVHVANYYFRRGAYIAALNRAQQVVKQYQQAPATEEALFVMMRSYQALGIQDLQRDTERIINANFPNSVYWTGGIKVKQPWWRVWSK
ncbi:MAG: outer membrane protein assembly factor BamD [Burkholderiaceae bacterium]|jgi:outer membrane protein assembly factor BamD